MPEVVVADTTPLIYLHRVGLLDLLPRLYERVVVPPMVAQEIARGLNLGATGPHLDRLAWMTIRAPASLIPASPGIHAGEREAISLAIETGWRVLIDDQPARRYLHRLGHPFTGTLGVLLAAKRSGFIPQVAPIAVALEQEGYWIDREALQKALAMVDEFLPVQP